MASDWYIRTKGEQVFSGLEKTQSEGLASVFDEFLNNVENAYDVTVSRNGIESVDTQAIINSKVNSKHGEKIVVFRKGEMKIGDYVEYGDNTFLISNWVNEDISMNDSAPMHRCNAIMTFKSITSVEDGKNGLGQPKYIDTTVNVDMPVVYDTEKYYSGLSSFNVTLHLPA